MDLSGSVKRYFSIQSLPQFWVCRDDFWLPLWPWEQPFCLSLWNGGAAWIISLRETLASDNRTLHSWLCRAGDAGCRQGRLSQNTLRPSFLSQWRLLPRRPLEVLISANQMENMWAMSVPADLLIKQHSWKSEIEKIVQFTDLIWLVMKSH